MIGNETGHLMKCVVLHRKFININETWYVLGRNIAVTSLKVLCKNLYSIKSYDKTNMKVFALSLWENFSWGLTYFDKFTCKFITFRIFLSIHFIQNLYTSLQV